MTEEKQPQLVDAQPRRSALSGIWIVPIVAAFIALYLGWQSYAQHGAEITISFQSGDSITAGQTQVRYKGISLGTVRSLAIDPKTRLVEVKVRMTRESAEYMTDRARFWMVRPRLASGDISGVETIIAGAFIQCDPGPQGKGNVGEKDHYQGLETPPTDRYDEPGTTYILKTDRLGPVSNGSAVYFRDVLVGEVLDYDIGTGFEPISIHVFIHAPYDKLVRPGTKFWNSSGFGLQVGPQGLQIQLQSLKSLIAGGIDFETPDDQKQLAAAPAKTVFTLYRDQDEADAAALRRRIPYVSYFESSAKNLGLNAPVFLYGIRVGTVSEVSLLVDPKTASARVRVGYEIEPERVANPVPEMPDMLMLTQRMVQHGLRAKIVSNNLLTGQQVLSLEFVPHAPSAAATMDKDAILIPPGPSGSIDNITDSLSDVTAKLDQIPFAQIGNNLNGLLLHADQMVAGPDMQSALHSLSATLAEARTLVQKADQGMTPALARLPQISADLQQSVAHANSALASVDQNSDLQHELRQSMDQIRDASQSIALLADFLDRHPEALIRGRSVKGAQ